MWLVIAHSHDIPAQWAAEGLRRQGLRPVEWIPAEILGQADYWEHRIGNGQVLTRIQLPDGRTIDSRQVRGILNRFQQVPAEHIQRMTETDRMYVFQEMSAFYLSWLVGFEIPVLNPASPNGLGGRNFHTLELFSLAVASGLSVPSIHLDTKFPDRDGWHSSQLISSDLLTSPQIYLIVVKKQLIADHQRNGHPPADVVEGCLELSRRTDLPLLGLHFVTPHNEPWMLIDVNPLPDLTVGGPALIEALAAALADSGIKGDKRL